MTAPTEAVEAVDTEDPRPAVEVLDAAAGEWAVRFPVMAIEDFDTSDGRYLSPGEIISRALPMTILAQPFSAHGGEDPPYAVTVGRLDTVERVPGPSVISRRTGEPFPEGTFVWVGHGAIDPSIDVHGLNIGNLMRRRFLNGASVDLAGMDVEMVGEGGLAADPEHPRREMIAHSAEIAAITLCPIPAFADAYVELVGDTEPFVPVTAEDLPAELGLAASAFPAWRSAEVGDYPALVAAGEEPGSYVEQVRDRIGAELGDDERSPAARTSPRTRCTTHGPWRSPAIAAASSAPVVEPADSNPTAEETVMAAAPPDPDPDGDGPMETGMPDAPQPCPLGGDGEHPAVRSLLYAKGAEFVSVCDEHEQEARDMIEAEGEEVERVVEIEQGDAAADEQDKAP